MAGTENAAGPVYAGFWVRVAAHILDSIFLIVAYVALAIALATLGLLESVPKAAETAGDADLRSSVKYVLPAWILGIGNLLYWSLLEGGPRQATIGKRLVGLKVTALSGEKLDVIRAGLRTWPLWFPPFASVVNDTLGAAMALVALVSCVVVAFTAHKQGVHDMIAKCVVIRKPAP